MVLLSFPLFVHFSLSPIKLFVTEFSAPITARVFKFCIHLESGQVYCGKETQDAVINFCLPFPFFLFSISHSSVLHREICDKYFSGAVARRILLFGTSVVNHLLFYVKENKISPTYSSLNFFIFLSLQFSNIKKFHLSFLRDRESHKVETWSTHEQ